MHPRREILHGDPQRFEQGDLIVRPPAGDRAFEHLADLSENVGVGDRPLLAGEEEIAGLGEQRLPAVREQARARDRRRVQLPGLRRAGPHGVDVGSRRDPVPQEDRLRGGGDRADQIRSRDRLAARGRRFHGQAGPLGLLGGEAAGALGPPAPDPHPAQRPHGAHGVQMGPRLHPGAEDGQIPGVPPCQRPGGHPARRRRADGGHRGGVQDRQGPPPLLLEQHHHPLVRLQAVQMILRHHRQHLGPGD